MGLGFGFEKLDFRFGNGECDLGFFLGFRVLGMGVCDLGFFLGFCVW